MKKTFKLKVENKNIDRQADAIKGEVKKYLKRERSKKLPESFDRWEFDCRIGESAEKHHTIKSENINKGIDDCVKKDFESFYLEILARPAVKPEKIK